ncbi:hypothetical protein BDV93DRAFT_558476 [Ceratobasidium sp. AG-I]|nr:hypothetical protein BDV93DRAFT_558476 [Ceratobasidium sp. AG-I]
MSWRDYFAMISCWLLVSGRVRILVHPHLLTAEPLAHDSFCLRLSYTDPLDDGDWVAVSSMVEAKTVADVMDQLVAAGAEDVLIVKLHNCRV